MFVWVKTQLLVLTVTLGGPLSLAFSSLPSSSFLPLFLFLMSLIEYANDPENLRRWFVFLLLWLTFSFHMGARLHWPHTLFNYHPLIRGITLAQIFFPRATMIGYLHSALKENDANNKVTFSIMTYKLRKRVVATLKICLAKRKNAFNYKKAEWGIHR